MYISCESLRDILHLRLALKTHCELCFIVWGPTDRRQNKDMQTELLAFVIISEDILECEMCSFQPSFPRTTARKSSRAQNILVRLEAACSTVCTPGLGFSQPRAGDFVPALQA